MAKKTSTRRGDFTMAAEVRNILEESPQLSGKETLEELKKRFPNQRINENSFGVAFSSARKKLGISKGRKKVRRRKPTATPATNRTSSAALDFETLQAARRYLTQVGDVDKAVNAIKQVQTLQIG